MKQKNTRKSAYANAGVDIDAMMQALDRSKKRIQDTFNDDVRSELGTFGGLFQAPGRQSLLVSSVDGVGTKLKVAALAGKHNTVGQDLVNHCVNDILVQGAKPLFFMDYVGAAQLDPAVFEEVVKGLCQACVENGCALLGGETAEMPGLYPRGEYDLVGAIVGHVEKKRLITGRTIRPGHQLIGLPSTGLHTNGFSLARKILLDEQKLAVHDPFPGLKSKTVATVLLAVHKSYLHPITALMEQTKIAGMAHITGGGLLDNLPRMLPEDCSAIIHRTSWRIPKLFTTLRDLGSISDQEMYRVFNMGIGMVMAIPPEETDNAINTLKEQGEKPKIIGHIEKGPRQTIMTD